MSNITNSFKGFADVVKFKAIKHGPTIAVIGGTVAIVGGSILACRQTFTKAHKLLEKHHERLDEVKEVKEKFSDEVYSEKDYSKDITFCYVKTVFDFVKLYALPATLMTAGIVSILAGHKILKNRAIAISGALTGVQKMLSEYRERVKEEVGEEKEKEIYTSKRREKLNEAKKEMANEDGAIDYPNYSTKYSPYSRIFDEYNSHYDKDPIINQFFLKSRQNYWNDVLSSRRSHVVFLNEVLDDLGYDMTPEGAIVGWYKYSDEGDGYIDFGYQDDRDFMQGNESSVILDFNIDPGTVHDIL